MTPLHLACTHGSTEIVAMLIKNGAAIRCTDEQDNTPLHLACLEGHTEIVKLLFSAGEEQSVLGEVSSKRSFKTMTFIKGWCSINDSSIGEIVSFSKFLVS